VKPDEVIAEVGDYMRQMLRFMAENRQHSVLPAAVEDLPMLAAAEDQAYRQLGRLATTTSVR